MMRLYFKTITYKGRINATCAIQIAFDLFVCLVKIHHTGVSCLISYVVFISLTILLFTRLSVFGCFPLINIDLDSLLTKSFYVVLLVRRFHLNII